MDAKADLESFSVRRVATSLSTSRINSFPTRERNCKVPQNCFKFACKIFKRKNESPASLLDEDDDDDDDDEDEEFIDLLSDAVPFRYKSCENTTCLRQIEVSGRPPPRLLLFFLPWGAFYERGVVARLRKIVSPEIAIYYAEWKEKWLLHESWISHKSPSALPRQKLSTILTPLTISSKASTLRAFQRNSLSVIPYSSPSTTQIGVHFWWACNCHLPSQIVILPLKSGLLWIDDREAFTLRRLCLGSNRDNSTTAQNRLLVNKDFGYL